LESFVINKLGVIKFIAGGIVSIGATKVVGEVIKSQVKPENLLDKITMTAASWAIGGMVAAGSKKYVEDCVDDVAEIATQVITGAKLSMKLARIDRNTSTFEKEGLDPTDFEKNPKTGRLQKKQTPESVRSEKLDKIKKMMKDEGLAGATLRRNDAGEWEVVEKQKP
jgi:hypothetical protein